MSQLLDQPALNSCGCCQGGAAQTPVLLTNRPGLSALAYRVGDHAQFKHTLLARLSAFDLPALSALTARDDNDFSIALLDAWATVGDVLTFYQERIANESYLRTATERLSLLYLARLIGYELRPGVAASTLLAFTVEDAPGAPQRATVDVGVKVQSVPGPGQQPQTFETTEKLEALAQWNALKPKTGIQQVLTAGKTKIYLAGAEANLRKGDLLLFVSPDRATNPTSDRWALRRAAAVTPDSQAKRTQVNLDAALSSGLEGGTVYVLRQRAALFGYNAPDPKVLATDTILNFKGRISQLDDKGKPQPNSDWKFEFAGQIINLDAAYPAVLKDSWLVFTRPSLQTLYSIKAVAEVARADYAMTAKTTQAELNTTEDLNAHWGGGNYRSTAVYAQSELLTLLPEEPLPDDSPTGFVDTLLLDRAVNGLTQGKQMILSGKLAGSGDRRVEGLTLAAATPAGALTQLKFTTKLQHNYQLASVVLYANVVSATQGETTQEALGAGDATKPYQQFTLRQAPLTYVRDPKATSGAVSTLQVRVNDVLWQEVATLFGRAQGAPANERIYVTRTDDAGKTTVEFGDGQTGRRLPTGAANVRATYRKGSGAAGNVDADQLTTVLTRPLGVKSVTNPQPATGGADREQREDARRNMPLTVLTLDRIVSLLDYENFARAYIGIAKAQATWTWIGQTRGIFVTVAGVDGAPVPPDSDLYKNLLAAMQNAGDPYVPLRVQSYTSHAFTLKAKVKVAADFANDQVLAAVTQALQTAFSFASRAFGQAVTLSEVVAVMHKVAGVQAVDVDTLQRNDGVAQRAPRDGLQHPLPAAAPHLGANGAVSPAELLTLDSTTLVLEVIA